METIRWWRAERARVFGIYQVILRGALLCPLLFLRVARHYQEDGIADIMCHVKSSYAFRTVKLLFILGGARARHGREGRARARNKDGGTDERKTNRDDGGGGGGPADPSRRP